MIRRAKKLIEEFKRCLDSDDVVDSILEKKELGNNPSLIFFY